MARNVFHDPAGLVADYPWPINHTTEESFGKRRNITVTSPTAGIGHILQQADDTPMVIKLGGTILTRAQHAAFAAWFERSRSRSVYFTDFAGDTYEVLIVAYEPTRQRTVRNPRDQANAPLWFWRYTMELHVLNFGVGPWAGVSP
jgi:hypothetical protein